MPRQLGLPLEPHPTQGAGDFLVAPSNEAAVRFIDRWPDWPVRAIALHGPSGSGKSHLIAVWCARSGAECVSASCLTADWLAQLAPGAAVAIDDMDDAGAPPTTARDRVLLALFERPAAALLLSGRGAPGTWPYAVGDLRSRFAAIVACALHPPDDILLAGLARKMFSDRGVAVPDSVIRRMLVALDRTPAAVAAFVRGADAKALAEKRPVSVRLVSELLGPGDG